MGNLSNRAIHSIFGCPTELETIVIEFSSTPSVTELKANSIYRFAATEDCLIDLDSDGSVTAVTADGVLVFAGVPEMFSTTSDNKILAVLSSGTDGNLHVTRMITRAV